MLSATASRVSPQLSWQIKIASLICIILVVFIHTYNASQFVDTPALYWSALSINGVLGHLAVPIFFCISGYLFFIGTDSDRGGENRSK